MQLKQLVLLFVLLFRIVCSYGQGVTQDKVNTLGAEAYLKLASELMTVHQDNPHQWQLFFQIPIYQMLIAGEAIDTTALKLEMLHVFAPTTATSNTTFSLKEKYHEAYKDQINELTTYIRMLHTLNVKDSVKVLLQPYLPVRLQTEELFPTLFYLNYGRAEATGLGGIVINDLLLSYRIDSYKFGLLAAHEAFHSIVSSAFQQKLKKDIDYNAADFNLLYFLQNVSEEGVADLIDKPLLLHHDSPLFQELKQMTENDEEFSLTYIRRLDSVLAFTFVSGQLPPQYRSFADFANSFGKNGGHMPGRLMGKVIKNAGLLGTHLETIEDPISFILAYNKAVGKSKKKYPVFSNESVTYLQRLRARYWLN